MKDRPTALLLAGAAPMAQAATRLLDQTSLNLIAVVTPAVASVAKSPFAVRPNSVASQRLLNAAQSAGVPLIAVADDVDLVKRVTQAQPDLLLSVCFPGRIPDAAVASVRRMALNLHPSALPAWRGPDPLFWQLRHGLARIEVCWHRIAPRMDSGEVVVQTAVTVEGADTEDIIEERVADAGIRRLKSLLDGHGVPAAARSVSGIARGRWWRSPVQGDYRIFRSWRCDHAVRFITVFSARGVPFLAPGANGPVWITGLAPPSAPADRTVTVNLLDGAIQALRC